MSNNSDVVLQIKAEIKDYITTIYKEYESEHNDALKLMNISFLSGIINGLLEALIPFDESYTEFVAAYMEVKSDMDKSSVWLDKLYRTLKKEG